MSEVDPNKKGRFHTIKGLLTKADCCVIATDPAREGGTNIGIGRTIISACGFKDKLKRLWISDLTPETIRAGFQQHMYDENIVLDWLENRNSGRPWTEK